MRADFGPARALLASDGSRPLMSAREVAAAGAATGAPKGALKVRIQRPEEARQLTIIAF